MTRVPAPCVLVVEDDDDTRETLRAALEDADYAVEVASDGAQALAQLRARQDRLVTLLDLLMPGVDGFQVLQAAAAEPLVGRHAFILMTADGRPPSPRLSDLLTRLQVPLVTKPFDLDRLLEVVAEAAARLA